MLLAISKTLISSYDAFKMLPNAEIIITSGLVEEATIGLCKNLKWVFSLSAGVEGLPFDKLIEMGVRVTNTRGIHAPQIAEQIIGMMINFSRGLNRSFKNQTNKN